MLHFVRIAIVLLSLVAAAGAAKAQCFPGTDQNDPPDPQVSYVWQNDFIALTRLGSHFMPLFGDGDSMTEPFWLNGGMTKPFGSEGPRETWYILRDNLAGTAPFYRLAGGGGTDHMDSDDPNEASGFGYQMEFQHGRAWTSQKPGTQPLSRYFKLDIFDHRTWLFSQTPSGYAADRRWDAASGVPRYGYQRFGNLLQQCDVLAIAYQNNSLENALLKVDLNKVWGNAIGRIYWKPANTQLVREQTGAMVQSTIFNTVNGVCCDYNPTQSGGADVKNFANTRRWAGSPVLSSSFSGTTTKTNVTEVKPFNFSFNRWVGNDSWSPLMWRGAFKKTTTLGYNLDGTVYNDVILMRFEAKLDDSAVRTTGHNMNNTFWLTMNPFGDGNVKNFTIEMVNLDTGASEVLAHPAGFNATIDPPILGRGVVISNAARTFAVGFHAPNSPDNYHIMYFCDGAVPSGGTCPFAYQAIVFNTFNNQTLSTFYDAGKREDAYMVVGDRATVITRLKRIHCKLKGGLSCNSVQ